MSWVFLSTLIIAITPLQESIPTVCVEGIARYRSNDYEAAEPLLRSCKEAAPGLIRPYLLLCAIYQKNSQEEELRTTALEGLQRFPEEQRFYLTAGVLTGRQGDYARAVEIFGQAAELWPHQPEIRHNLVQAHLAFGLEALDQGNHEQAVASLEQVVELDPEQVDGWINLGRALHNLKRSTDALKAFEAAAALDGAAHAQLDFQRGIVLYDLGRFADAISAFSRELESSKHPPAYLFRGLSFMMLGEWRRALEDLGQVSETMGADVEVLFARARCERRLDNVEEAERLVRRALEIDVEDPRLHHFLGRLLIETGRTVEGELSLARARDLNERRRAVQPGEVQFQAYRKSTSN